jgi:dienelactone hydrolase
MQPISTLFVAGLLAALGPSLAPAQSTFILRRGTDTISLERFSRTDRQVEADMLVKPQSARLRYQLTFGPDGRATGAQSWFGMASDPDGTPPRQRAEVTFAGDSVVVDVHAQGSTTPATQRLASKAGAFLHINPSFAVWEPVLAWAKRARATSVSMFALAGGTTFDATIEWVGQDSVVMTMPGGAVHLGLDAAGRITGGSIPAQGLVIERSETLPPAALRLEKPDYSAPPGAPYLAEDVAVPTPMGHTLAGTLTLPAGAGGGRRVPAIVTITGSGGQDRDEAIPMFRGYRPFRELADALARAGIAVLRMDDRGVGSSGGNAGTATTADFAQDIRAGLAYLRTRSEIDGARLGLVGHSEGGIIAPMVAVLEPDLKGIVLLAGTSRSGRTVLTFQLTNGIRNDTSLKGARLDSALATVPAMVDSAATMPWMKFFLDYEPLTAARKVRRTPVLVLNGETDQQVTPDQVPELVEAFRSAGNPDVTSHVFPDLNHLFVHDPDGFPGRYTQLGSFQVDPQVLKMVVDWLSKRLVAGTS